MVNTAKKLRATAVQERPYYIENLKHLIEQAYYRHHETLFECEINNLALEIYLRSYSVKEMQMLVTAPNDLVFSSDSIKFYIKDNDEQVPVRLDIGDNNLFLVDHSPVVLESDDELAVHYRDIIRRMTALRDSDELTALLRRVDTLAQSRTYTTFIREVKKVSKHVKTAERLMNKANSER
ncbi:hypothetical protein JCM19235_1304 [Vibrio maritimus]|uniref:Uncharacterized protein n=1 Tax=Vibrio maritimus TaxID=990268 RepID=A0A090S8A7_9VIBR|nr:hypothetical protein JCM19235_1304 [Vibrio maritimus]